MPHLSAATGGGSGVVARGPTGSYTPPNTPAYNAAATATAATAAQLNTALAAASAGSVIEVTADISGDGTLNPVAGASGWATKVLVRPPVGQRKKFTYINNNCPNVVVAGFDWVKTLHTAYAAGISKSGSYFWRCVEERGRDSQIWRISGDQGTVVDGAGFVECATPYWGMGERSDIMDITASNAGGGVTNPLVLGCFFAPAVPMALDDATMHTWTPVSGPDAGVTFTNPGNPIYYFAGVPDLGQGSGAFAQGATIPLGTVGQTMDYTAVAGNNATTGAVNMCVGVWLDAPRSDAVTFALSINGTPWTLPVPLTLVGPDYRFALVRSIPGVHFSPGDVITAVPDKAVTGVHMIAGIDAQNGPGRDGPDNHVDAIQMYGVTVAPVAGGIFRNNVIGGPASNKAFQLNTPIAGDMVYDNNFIGRLSSGWDYGHFGIGVQRDYMRANTFQGTATLNTNGGLVVFESNDANDFTQAVSGSNVTRGTVLPTPLPPNLAALWPECPYTVNGY